jgi:DNA invertase Pin-like site-specific DNA recombinase
VKTVAYLRVSTDRQAEEGLGLAVQEQAIRAWARESKHRIVAWHRDEGVSGSNGIETRLGLADALDDLRAHRAQAIVVYRLDRLARDLVLQEQLLAELRRMPRELFTTAAGEQDYLRDDPTDPSRKLIRQVLGAVNEYERAMIRLRLQAGARRKKEQGGYAGGQPPFGWAARNGQLVPVEAEQSIIRRMRELRAAGVSCRQVAAALNTEGTLSRNGKPWQDVVIGRILQRDGR